jgi:hypothetical protein
MTWRQVGVVLIYQEALKEAWISSFRSPKWASPLDGVVNLGMDTGFVGVLMSSL